MSDATTDNVESADPLAQPARSMWSDAWHSLRRRPEVIVSSVWILIVIAMAIAPGLFATRDYKHCVLDNSKTKPEWFGGDFILGTDLQGCDLYSASVAGARPSLLLSLMVIVFTLFVAFAVGSIAGYYGGWWDNLVSRAVEIFDSIPFFVGALILLVLFSDVDLGGGQVLAVLPATFALALFAWTGNTRLVRGSTLQAKNFDYVNAAKSLGARDRRIIFRHVLPNAIAPVVAGLPLAVSGLISTEAALSFLGYGIRPPEVSWGSLIAEGAPWASGGMPHMLLVPGTFLVLTVVSFALVGDALRDALDPKLR